MLPNMPTEAEVRSLNVDTIFGLYRRQDELEKELKDLRDMYKEMKERNDQTIGRVHERIDKLEKELADLRATLNELKLSIGLVQVSVDTVKTHVSEINAKTDITLNAQDRFINQLWKAFFALLGVITVAGGAVFALMK